MSRSFRALARCLAACVLVTGISAILPALADSSPQLNLGLKWLGAQVQPDGALSNEQQSIATPMQARGEAARTLKLLAQTPPALLDVIVADTDSNTEYLARQIVALSAAGRDANAQLVTLIARQNDDGGVGGAPGYASNPLDTAFALAALRAAGRSDSAVEKAEAYLLTEQGDDGAFATVDGAASIHLTALVSGALQSSANSTRAQAAVGRANTWLLSKQQRDGSWGSVGATSLVQLALVGTTSDSALQQIIATAILSRQDVDGSWGQDPYVTALALRALHARPGQTPTGTDGSIVGKIVVSGSGIPISGALATLGSGASATSDGSGKFAFASVAPGMHALTVSANGYGARGFTIDVRAGMASDLGAVALVPNANSGILKGTVLDSDSSLPIAGALISVTGATNTAVYTAADGSYQVAGLAPGAIHLVASKTGYAGAQADGVVVAGNILQFSPKLAMASTVATLKGRIVDAATSSPLGGVTVAAGTGLSAVTSADGRFSLAGISGGKVDVVLSLPDYATKAFSFLVSAGVDVDVQTIVLSKTASPATTATIEGVVTDAASGTPIPGVTIKVSGSVALSAVTAADGSYALQNVTPGSLALLASKANYISAGAGATATAGATLVFSPRLDGAIVPGITGLVVDRETLAPLAGATATLADNMPADLIALSDAGGRWRFPDVGGTMHTLALSAPGYTTYSQLVVAGQGQLTEVPVTRLAKTSELLAVSGKVTDAASGKGIAKASVLILGTPLSAVTDMEGNYKIDGAGQGQATIKYSASGYISDTVVLALSPYDVSPHDRALRAGQASSLALGLSTDKGRYQAYEPVLIAAELDNGGTEPVNARLSVTILDANGEYVDSFTATRTDADGVRQTLFAFASGLSTVNLEWNTLANLPAAYTALVRVHQDNADGVAVELAQKQAGFAVDPTQAIDSVRLTPLPAFANVQAQEQLSYRVDVVNRSNVAVEGSFDYKLLTPAGAVADSGAFKLTLTPAEPTRSFFVTGAKLTFAASGTHQSTLASTDGVMPAKLMAGQISVAPGTRIDPTMMVTPDRVTPDGDKRTRIEIRLQGVEQK